MTPYESCHYVNCLPTNHGEDGRDFYKLSVCLTSSKACSDADISLLAAVVHAVGDGYKCENIKTWHFSLLLHASCIKLTKSADIFEPF